MKFRFTGIGAVQILLMCAAVFLGACAATHGLKPEGSDEEQRVWPPAPSRPRVEYLGAISQPDDLQIHKGLLARLKEVAVGKEDRHIMLPTAVVENSVGQLFVADAGKKAIHRFDKNRGKYRLIKRKGNRDFASPVGMASDGKGNLYIADSELAKVYFLRLNDDFAESLPLDGNFVRPTGLAVDHEKGWIYVVDTGAHSICVFNSANSLVKKIGRRGNGDGEFNFPTYLWQNKDGDLLVTDSLNFRIQLFDRYGRFIRKFGGAGNGTGDLARPKGVAEDSSKHIYVVDSLFHNVQVFDESGNFLLNFGEQGQGPGQFWLPVGITITEDDTIYVADSYNKRVQVFRYVGTEP